MAAPSAEEAHAPARPGGVAVGGGDAPSDASEAGQQGAGAPPRSATPPPDGAAGTPAGSVQGMEAAAVSAPVQLVSKRDWATAVLFTFLLSGVYTNQNILSSNLTAIQHDFGMTAAERDQKLGGAARWAGCL